MTFHDVLQGCGRWTGPSFVIPAPEPHRIHTSVPVGSALRAPTVAPAPACPRPRAGKPGPSPGSGGSPGSGSGTGPGGRSRSSPAAALARVRVPDRVQDDHMAPGSVATGFTHLVLPCIQHARGPGYCPLCALFRRPGPRSGAQPRSWRQFQRLSLLSTGCGDIASQGWAPARGPGRRLEACVAKSPDRDVRMR